MWIWREKYETLLREIADGHRKASQFKAEADGATRLAIHVEEELRRLRTTAENERQRAENAVDELLKLKAQADPISPESVVRQRVNPAEMDNMFEDEDEDAVKRLLERAEAVGVQTIYSEALEEQNES